MERDEKKMEEVGEGEKGGENKGKKLKEWEKEILEILFFPPGKSNFTIGLVFIIWDVCICSAVLEKELIKKST